MDNIKINLPTYLNELSGITLASLLQASRDTMPSHRSQQLKN